MGDYESSVHRIYRSAQYNTRANPPSSHADIMTFLSDTVDTDYKVYRGNSLNGSSSVDPYITLTTSLFDLCGKKVHIFTNRSSDHPPAVILDLEDPLAWPDLQRGV